MSMYCKHCDIGKATNDFIKLSRERKKPIDFILISDSAIESKLQKVSKKKELQESVFYLAAMYYRSFHAGGQNGNFYFGIFQELLEESNPIKYNNGWETAYCYTTAKEYWEIHKKRCKMIKKLIDTEFSVQDILSIASYYLYKRKS